MNVCVLMGRLTADPVLKRTQSDVAVTSNTLAVDRAYTPKGQEKQTDFISIVAWRGTAEFICKYFRKGQRMAVKGELQQRTYTANDGSKRNVYEVVVDAAFFCESKAEQSKAEPSDEMPADVPGTGFEVMGFADVTGDVDDLPF